MKTRFIILLILLVLRQSSDGHSVNVEDFKKVTDDIERIKMIEQAPPEEKEKLNRINRHIIMAESLGGEAGFVGAKERSIVKSRGFLTLEDIFGAQTAQTQIWDAYMAAVYDLNRQSAMTHQAQDEMWKRLQKERDAIGDRLQIVNSLVSNLAVSPGAKKLEQRAEKLSANISDRLLIVNSSPPHPVTKEERLAVDKQMDQIFEELKKLPKLTPEEAKKEFDAFPEEEVGAW